MADFRETLQVALGDRYLIERELGHGGMATVYAAVDRRHTRPVAIKIMRPGLAAAIGPDRFEREIATAAGLAHPHIVPVFDSGVLGTGSSAQPYYVMPLIEGRSLRERIARDGPLPIDEVLAIGRDVGSALEFAHAHGVIHRDVKPENILLAGGQALLTDFGIARPIDQRQREALTSTGFAVGTPAYMSPEQIAANPRLDGRSDLYALAVTLYEALGGALPFDGPTPQAVLARQMAGEVRPLHTIRPGVSVAVDQVLRRALAPSPADRYPTVAGFLAAIDQAAAAVGRPRRRWRTAGLVGAAGAVVAAGYLWTATRSSPAGDGRLAVAIMPFRSPSAAASLGEALPDLMVTLLAGTPRLRVADPWALWRPLRRTPQDQARSPDLAEAVKLGSRSGADRVVLGRIEQAASQLNLNIRIYGVGIGLGDEALAQFTVSAPIDSTETLARRAVIEVLGQVWTGSAVPLNTAPEVASLTQSPEALKAYLQAREAMRRGQPDSADAAIQRSLGLDSTFALAALEAMTIRSWSQFLRGQPFRGLRELLAIAEARAASLSERDRLRLEAGQAGISGDGPRAATAWQRLIDLDSTNVEAWNNLAYVHLVSGWQYGATDADLRRAVDRALVLDSTHVPALFRLGQLASAASDDRPAREAIERLRSLEMNSPLLRGARLGLEALVASDAEYGARLAEFTALPPLEWGSVFRRLRAYRPDRALALARRTREQGTPGFKLQFASNGEAGLLAALSRWEDLDSLIRAGTYSGVPALDVVLHWKRIAARIAGAADSGAIGAVAATAARLPIDSARHWIQRAPVWKAGWLLGAYHATAGDTDIAARWRATLEGMPREGFPATWGPADAADIGSRLAERAGALDSARFLADEAFRLWGIHAEGATEDDPEPAFRFRVATGLLAAGRPDSAAALLRSLIPPASWVGVYTIRALLTLGEIAAARKDPVAAARHFDGALAALEMAGPALAGWRDRAIAGVRASGVTPFRFGR
ncbi:MAG: protein kinase domain-containing protein [Gemmatimonadales bacterium]